MYQIGSDKQLFIDHRFIESSENITLVVNPPIKRAEPFFRSDKPWEAFRLGWYSIVEDERYVQNVVLRDRRRPVGRR